MTPAQFKDWRLSLTWSQEDAAKALGMSRGAIGNYETGRRREDNRPVEIPLVVEYACKYLWIVAKAKGEIESDLDFIKRMKSTSSRDLPTDGEADRARSLIDAAETAEMYEAIFREDT